MKVRIHILLLLLFCASRAVMSQDSLSLKQPTPETLQVADRTDSLSKKTSLIHAGINSRTDSLSGLLQAPGDSVGAKLALFKQRIQLRLDSLKAKGQPSEELQKKLDSLNSISQLPAEQSNKLIALQHQLRDTVIANVPGLDQVKDVSNKTKAATNEINQVSTELNVAPLGVDLKPGVQTRLPDNTSMPPLSGNALAKTDLPSLGTAADNVAPDTNLPDVPNVNSGKKDIPLPNTNLNGLKPDEAEAAKNKVGEAGGELKKAGAIMNEGEEYGKDVKTIQEEGLAQSEKIPELTEQQLLKIDEIAVLEQQRLATLGKMDEHQKLIEQYKNEKAIREELEKRSKDLANDIFEKNQPSVDNAINKLSRTKRRFPQVHDARYLPKRPPNPMKGLGWRERVVPGFAFYTFSISRAWLQFDPQVFYKFNGSFAAGAGAMYRFSMNTREITFNDFNALHGLKVFAEYRAYKGFWLRAEAQQVFWKPWNLITKDPNHIDEVYVAAAGVCKNFNIGKRVKGNAQTLYHFSRGDSDPYKPKIMVRIGFDFSLKKKDKKPWSEKIPKSQ